MAQLSYSVDLLEALSSDGNKHNQTDVADLLDGLAVLLRQGSSIVASCIYIRVIAAGGQQNVFANQPRAHFAMEGFQLCISGWQSGCQSCSGLW